MARLNLFWPILVLMQCRQPRKKSINPQRDMPIGIIVSLLICTVIYMIFSGLLTGIVPYTSLNVPHPVCPFYDVACYQKLAALVSVGAIAGLTTVILVMYYGFTRIVLAMSRDGLLPNYLAHLHPTRLTPDTHHLYDRHFMTLVAGFAPISSVAELVNIGTLAAFTIVCIGTIVLR